MANIKGFFSIPSLTSNNIGQVSPVGELSPLALTYSREIGVYTSPTIDGIEFRSFTAKSTAGEQITVPTVVANGILTIGEYVTTEIVDGNAFTSPSQLALTLENTYASVGDTFVSGPFVILGGMHFPEWISYVAVDGAVTYNIKVWFADTAFRTQYKDFQIVVLPPASPVDLLFGTYTAVYTLINARTTEQLLQEAETAKAGYPYTRLKTMSFDWVNPANPAQRIPTLWGFLIYGEAGNNEDNIRSAAQEYILDNSAQTSLEWKTILPSLFVSTEFIVTPLWDRIAIANQTLSNGQYSSIIRPTDIEDYAVLTKGDYTLNHVRFVMRASVFTYKSLAFTIIGGSENVDGINRFEQRFPDYLPINPQSLDFQRMSPETQAWSNLMNAMLPVAESLTENSEVPITMSVIARSGKTFVASRLDNVLYLVAAKSNFA